MGEAKLRRIEFNYNNSTLLNQNQVPVKQFTQTNNIGPIEFVVDNPYKGYLTDDKYLSVESEFIKNQKNIKTINSTIVEKENELETLTLNYTNFKIMIGGSREDYNNDKLYFEILKRETGYNSIDEVESKIDSLNKDIFGLKMSAYKLRQYEKLIYFDNIRKTDEFKNYINKEKYNYPSSYLEILEAEKSIVEFHNMSVLNKYNCKSLDEFKEMKQLYYMDEEQRKMFNYLNSSKLKNEYLNAMLDYTNYQEGKTKAEHYINSLPNNALSNVSLLFKGVDGGLTSFINGIPNLFKHDGIRSVADYERIELLNLLQQNNKSDFTYNAGYIVGNATIPVIIDLLTEGMLTPATKSVEVATFTETSANLIGAIAGGTAAGLSEAGNSVEYALQVGSDLSDAYLYGAFRGATEAGLEIAGGSITSRLSVAGEVLVNVGSEFVIENGVENIVSAPILDNTVVNREELERVAGIDKVNDISDLQDVPDISAFMK